METKPVRVAVLCSGSASSFRYLCENDPNFGKSYEVVGVFSDEPRATGVAYAESHGIAMYVLDFKSWRKEYGTRHSDLQGRQDYFARVCSLIAPWRPDLIMLS